MQIDNSGILKLKATRLILKDALGYEKTDEEKLEFEIMTDEEKRMIRKNFLMNIRNKILNLDLLEEFLVGLKDQECSRYLANEGKNLDVETQMEKIADFESKYTRMIINIAQNNVSEDDILGPEIGKTYGVEANSNEEVSSIKF